MNPIVLHPDGRLFYGKRRVEGDPLAFLGFKVVLAKGCRLRSFFRLLERYPVLAQLNPFTPSYLSSYQGCPPTGCRFEEGAHLVLMRKVEMIGFPDDPSMHIFISFEGFKDGKARDIRPFWLEQLLDLPLLLGGLKHRVFGDTIDAFDFDTAFNFFELIDGICWQLSFHNLPDTCRMDI
ncbi:MAG: hypothetical protein P8X96_03645 [Desulfobacteraceae bacterium]